MINKDRRERGVDYLKTQNLCLGRQKLIDILHSMEFDAFERSKVRVNEISEFEQTVENLVNSVNYQDSILGVDCSKCHKVNTRTKCQ